MQQDLRRLIVLLKQLRAEEIPPEVLEDARLFHGKFSSVKSRRSDGDEPDLIPRPADFARMNLNDPFLRAYRKELPLVPDQHRKTFMSLMLQMMEATSNAFLADLSEAAEQILPTLDHQQTPCLWAMLHLVGAVSALYTSQNDPQPALTHCEAALSKLTQESAPSLWSRLLLTRSVIHMNILLNDTEHSLNEGERQARCQQLLQDLALTEAHFSQKEQSFEWAMLCATRGMALADGAERSGLTQERFTQIIADFDASLPIIARLGDLWQRILLLMRRAGILYHHRRGDWQATIARVLEDSSMVITLAQPRSSQKMAEVWADALILHGLACVERIGAAPSENAAQALKDFEQALSFYTRSTHPQDWALTLVNRGSVYMQMSTGDISENLEKALWDYQDALTVQPRTTTQRKRVGQTLLNRALCLMRRIEGEKTQNQRRALEDCNAALALFQQEGFRYEEAQALVNRAGIVMQLLADDRLANFRQAEADCSAALNILTATETPQEWAKALTNRGLARRVLAAGLGINQRGVGVRTLMQRLVHHHPASVAAMVEEAQGLYEQSLSDFSEALTILTRASHPLDWASALRERALTYAIQMQGYFTGDREKNIRRGILDLDNALFVFSRYETPYDWATTISHRAVLYAELVNMGWPDEAKSALADTDEALKVLTREAAPTNYCRLHYLRSTIFVDLKQWPQVHKELLQVREAQRDLIAGAPGSQEQTDIIAEFALADIYARDAWAISQIEPMNQKAIAIALEEGRALGARMAFDLDTFRLDQLPPGKRRERMAEFFNARDEWHKQQRRALYQPTRSQEQDLSAAYHRYLRARRCIRELDNPDFMTPVPTIQQIGQALGAPDEALVYLVAGSLLASTGGMAVIVTRDVARNPQVSFVRLPDLHELRLFDLFEGESDGTPQINIDESLAALGDMGLNKLVALLLQQRITKVRFVPYSWLGLFPLPSLLITAPNRQRFYLSELFAEVTMVPSARSLEVAQQGMQSQNHRHILLTAGNPEPHPPEEELRFAMAEAIAISKIAQMHRHPRSSIHYLPPPEITRARLMEELPQARYAHLALHAEYLAGDPRRSRLILSDIEGDNGPGRNIYLGEVLEGAIDLHGLRLLVLSACETSVIDMQRVPNEALGLAAGFLQAGASAVIASLWQVDDAATFLLMTRFAQFYLDTQEHRSPADALAAAQRWLRVEANNRVLATYDPALVAASEAKVRGLNYHRAIQKIRLQAKDSLKEGLEDAFPYAASFFWAGFIVVGA